MSIEIPGYKVQRVLGKGGMATVYLAIQEVFEREVALKIMSKALAEDPNFGQRFFREAKIVSKLVHPNIVTVHDVGKHGDHLYLSMEYIDGHDLRYRLPQLDLRQKIQVVRDIAKALDYAGAKGYVHRDIKPENIMFHSSDERAVLMDFGIARAAESNTTVTQTGTAIGTPHYMSPEQAKGKAVDSRSDIYSLGVVLYLMLAGRVPYDAESAVAIGIKHITEPVPLLPAEYKALQFLLDGMMAKNVKNRYQKASEIIALVDQLDIDLLEHSAKMIRASAGVGHADSTAVFEHVDDSYEEEFEYPEPERADVDDYAAYETEDTRIRGGFSFIPWLVSGSFVIAVIFGFLYVKDPQMVEAWIAAAKEKKEQWLSSSEKEQLIVDEEKVKAREQQRERENNAKAANEATGKIVRSTPKPTSTTKADVAKNQDQQKQQSPSPSIAPPVKVDNTQTIATLKNKINQLEPRAQESVYFAEMVRAYQELLPLVEGQEQAEIQSAYSELKSNEMKALREKAETQGRTPTLDKNIRQVKSLFPEIAQQEMQEIVELADRRKKVMSLLLEAQAYLNQNNLTQPRRRNALDTYDRVLQLDPDNDTAIQGRKQIAQKLVALANKRFESGKFEAAKQLLQKSISIDPDNSEALQMQKQVNAKLSRDQQIEDLLLSAKQKLDASQLFRPEGKGAYQEYSAVLKLDPDNAKALQGQDLVIDALSAKVWKLVGEKKTEEVKQTLSVPLTLLPNHQRVRSLALAVEEMIGEDVIVSNP